VAKLRSIYQAEIARLGEESGSPNIDGWSIDPDDITKLARCLETQSRHVGQIMFPDRPKGYVTATRNLAHYAWNKSTAMRCRLIGRITDALIYEEICEKIYARLPDFAKW
jgi:hypothetical protein